MPPLLRTKLRRKGFDLKELNLAITDCPLDLSRRAPNQVVVTKCKEKFCKDLIAHFSFAPKRCRSIKVFYPLPTKIFLYLYLYLFKNWSHQITTKYLFQPESPCICISSKTGLTQSKSNILFTNQNISLSVSVPLQKPIPPDQSQILWDCTSLYDAKVSRFEHHSNFSKLAFPRLTILQLIIYQTVNQGQIQRIWFSQFNL